MHLGYRIAQITPTLLLVSILAFGLQQPMPGEERGAQQVPAQIRAELWLDRSLRMQYLHWMNNVVHGDLGYSWRIRQPVLTLINPRLRGS
jgi:peptide/nickel transport system permease protein